MIKPTLVTTAIASANTQVSELGKVEYTIFAYSARKFFITFNTSTLSEQLLQAALFQVQAVEYALLYQFNYIPLQKEPVTQAEYEAITGLKPNQSLKDHPDCQTMVQISWQHMLTRQSGIWSAPFQKQASLDFQQGRLPEMECLAGLFDSENDLLFSQRKEQQ